MMYLGACILEVAIILVGCWEHVGHMQTQLVQSDDVVQHECTAYDMTAAFGRPSFIVGIMRAGVTGAKPIEAM